MKQRSRTVLRMLRMGAILMAVAVVACSSAPSSAPSAASAAVAVQGTTDDLSVLAGEWWGEYSSAMTGRSGRIRFNLESDESTAFGDVLMLPDHRPGSDGEAGLVGGSEQPNSGQTLTIRFVRVTGDDETVSGVLDSYEDPDCSCRLTTTFVGTVRDGFIEGTYTSRAGGGHPTTTGTWRVDRSNEETP